MKIVLVSSTSDAVGVSTHLSSLAQLLHEENLLDMVVVPAEGPLVDRLRANDLPVEVLPLSVRPAAFISSSIRFLRFLRSRPEATVVHLHGRFPLFLSWLPSLLEKRLTFVITIHQFMVAGSGGAGRWKTRLETFMMRRMDAVSCVSHALREETTARLGGSYPTDRIFCIPNWIQPLHLNSRSEPHQRHHLCAVGRLAPEKGFDLLVEAFAILRTQGFKVPCDIIGEGPERDYLSSMIATKGLTDQIALKGRVANIRESLPSYSLILIPSRSESFGLVALEAYDSGLPIIASDVPGLNEVVQAEETGILFEAGNPQALAEAIMRVMQSDELRARLIQNGRAALERFLPGSELAAQFRELYRTASARGNTGRVP